jgi:hypothetical protein
MGFTGWSQRDTLTTGHGHCRDNKRQGSEEIAALVHRLAGQGLALHGLLADPQERANCPKFALAR